MNKLMKKLFKISFFGIGSLFALLTFVAMIFIILYALGSGKDDVAFFGNDEYVVSKVADRYELFKDNEVILTNVEGFTQKNKEVYVFGQEEFVVIDENDNSYRKKENSSKSVDYKEISKGMKYFE